MMNLLKNYGNERKCNSLNNTKHWKTIFFEVEKWKTNGTEIAGNSPFFFSAISSVINGWFLACGTRKHKGQKYH